MAWRMTMEPLQMSGMRRGTDESPAVGPPHCPMSGQQQPPLPPLPVIGGQHQHQRSQSSTLPHFTNQLLTSNSLRIGSSQRPPLPHPSVLPSVPQLTFTAGKRYGSAASPNVVQAQSYQNGIVHASDGIDAVPSGPAAGGRIVTASPLLMLYSAQAPTQYATAAINQPYDPGSSSHQHLLPSTTLRSRPPSISPGGRHSHSPSASPTNGSASRADTRSPTAEPNSRTRPFHADDGNSGSAWHRFLHYSAVGAQLRYAVRSLQSLLSVGRAVAAHMTHVLPFLLTRSHKLIALWLHTAKYLLLGRGKLYFYLSSSVAGMLVRHRRRSSGDAMRAIQRASPTNTHSTITSSVLPMTGHSLHLLLTRLRSQLSSDQAVNYLLVGSIACSTLYFLIKWTRVHIDNAKEFAPSKDFGRERVLSQTHPKQPSAAQSPQPSSSAVHAASVAQPLNLPNNRHSLPPRLDGLLRDAALFDPPRPAAPASHLPPEPILAFPAAPQTRSSDYSLASQRLAQLKSRMLQQQPAVAVTALTLNQHAEGSTHSASPASEDDEVFDTPRSESVQSRARSVSPAPTT